MMKGKLKALGLALVAAMAMSAVAAGSASAEVGVFTIGEGATTLEARAESTQVFKTTIDELGCTEAGIASSSFETGETGEITATPEYGGCEAVEQNLTTHVDPTGCDFLFTATTVGDHAPLHIECENPGEHIDTNITFFGERPCLEIPEQTPTVGGVTYQNETYVENEANHWDVRIDATLEGIKYTEVGGSLCTDEDEDVVVNDGTYEGEVTVKARDNEGNPVDITYSD